MKSVAKLIIAIPDDYYLMMYRNNHPTFGDDPDLPGGTVELGEASSAAMVREVKEEIGVDIEEKDTEEIYSGTEYSSHGTRYSLFIARLSKKPDITMSWEHSDYKWVNKEDFLLIAKNAKDTYMHMAHDVLRSLV